jgi:hypothetical protein
LGGRPSKLPLCLPVEAPSACLLDWAAPARLSLPPATLRDPKLCWLLAALLLQLPVLCSCRASCAMLTLALRRGA